MPQDPSMLTESSVWSDLDRMFGSEPDYDALNDELIERRQHENESYEELAVSILNLVRMLEPDADEKSHDRRALAHFIRAISDSYVLEWTRNRGCLTLDEAVKYANSMLRSKAQFDKHKVEKNVSFSDELLHEIEGQTSNNMLDILDQLNQRLEFLEREHDSRMHFQDADYSYSHVPFSEYVPLNNQRSILEDWIDHPKSKCPRTRRRNL